MRRSTSFVWLSWLALGGCGGEEEGFLVVGAAARVEGARVILGDRAQPARVLPYVVPFGKDVRIELAGESVDVDVEPGEVVRVDLMASPEGKNEHLAIEAAQGEALEVGGDETAVAELALAIDADSVPLGAGLFHLESEGPPALIERAAYLDDILGVLEVDPTDTRAPSDQADSQPARAGIEASSFLLGRRLRVRLEGFRAGERVRIRLLSADDRREVLRTEAVAGSPLDLDLRVPPGLLPDSLCLVVEGAGRVAETNPIPGRHRLVYYLGYENSLLPATGKDLEVQFGNDTFVPATTDSLGLVVVDDAPGDYQLVSPHLAVRPRPYAFDSGRAETYENVADALRSDDLAVLTYGLFDAHRLARPEWQPDIEASLLHAHPAVWTMAAIALGSYPPEALSGMEYDLIRLRRWDAVRYAAGP